jgi:hypothetical protein
LSVATGFTDDDDDDDDDKVTIMAPSSMCTLADPGEEEEDFVVRASPRSIVCRQLT